MKLLNPNGKEFLRDYGEREREKVALEIEKVHKDWIIPFVKKMKPKNLLDVPSKWPKTHRSFNARLIPERLAELARAGVYFESRIIN